MIKMDWDGRVEDDDVEQEDLLAQLHAEHMDQDHICIEDECPYWRKDGE